ncbi:unnamed protein product [Gordionus sp. m RMFG-2023]|uniref:protein vav-1-like isoform X2 n=1 Tax=Gordionus sp. m RMFG-2023 TaxID=3053472 RepID=UPI0030E5AA83
MSKTDWKECLNWLLRYLAQILRDGVILCNLLNHLHPNCINTKDVILKPQMGQFFCLRNIRLFLQKCQILFCLNTNELFDPCMLYDLSDFAKVINTLSILSKTSKAIKITCGFDFEEENHLAEHEDKSDTYKDFEIFADQDDLKERQSITVTDQITNTDDELYEQLCTLKRNNHQILLSSPKDKREHCIRELMDTESNYIKALKDVVNNFMERMKSILSPRDINIIYGKIGVLIEIHEKLEKRFNEATSLCSVGSIPNLNRLSFDSRLHANILTAGPLYIGDCFQEFADKFLVYGEYCTQLGQSQAYIDRLLECNDKFRTMLWECQISASQGKFHLRDLIALPMQRILRYHILIKELLKHTPDNTDEKVALLKALDSMLDLTDYVNEVKRDAEDMEMTNDIQRNISRLTMPEDSKLSVYGRLLKDGELKVKSRLNSRLKNRFIFLFDTIILLCKSTKSDTYNFKDSLSLSEFRVNLPQIPEPMAKDFLSSLRNKNNGCPLNIDITTTAWWKQKYKKESKWGYQWVLESFDHQNVYNIYAKTYDAWLKWLQVLLLAQDNIKPHTRNRTNHLFDYVSFPQPTRCSFCKKLLKGIIYQGYQCRERKCGYAVHKQCIELLDVGCEPIQNNLMADSHTSQPPVVPIRAFDDLPNKESKIAKNYLEKPKDTLPINGSSSTTHNTPRRHQSSIEIGHSKSPNINNQISKNYYNLNLNAKSWFIGDMNREKAKLLLQSCPSGTFLVRFSSQQGGNPVITLKYFDDVKHIKILKNEPKGYYISDHHYFASIVELVSHYQTCSLAKFFKGLNTVLAHPYLSEPFKKMKTFGSHDSLIPEAPSNFKIHEHKKSSSSSSCSSNADSSSLPPTEPSFLDSPALQKKPHIERMSRCYKQKAPLLAGPNLLSPTVKPSALTGRAYVGRATAIFDFIAQSDKMLSLTKGDKLLIIDKIGTEKGWWKGQLLNQSRTGYFPIKYVTEED